jgi:hypothetical protein
MREEKVMIRKLAITLITLAIMWSGTVLGALEALEQVTELDASGVRLPTSSVGQVVYRKCSGCEATIWPVNAASTYYIGLGTTPVPLAEFRKAVASKKGEMILVFYAPDSGVVTRVVLGLRTAAE